MTKRIQAKNAEVVSPPCDVSQFGIKYKGRLVRTFKLAQTIFHDKDGCNVRMGRRYCFVNGKQAPLQDGTMIARKVQEKCRQNSVTDAKPARSVAQI